MSSGWDSHGYENPSLLIQGRTCHHPQLASVGLCDHTIVEVLSKRVHSHTDLKVHMTLWHTVPYPLSLAAQAAQHLGYLLGASPYASIIRSSTGQESPSPHLVTTPLPRLASWTDVFQLPR